MSEPECGDSEVDSRMPADLSRTQHEEASEHEDTHQQESGLNTNYDSSDGAIPNHRCEGCDYETMSRAALARHSVACSVAGKNGTAPRSGPPSSKMFECDICQMRFSNGANMRRHRMRHTGVKPYECRVCGKRFFRKDHLAEHTTTHAKALPWACPICHRGFQRQIAMRAHFQNEHVTNSNNGVNGDSKCCPLCSYKAGTMKSLRVHFYNRHGIDLDRPALAQNGTGDRNMDNATPPMHFLTPHIEISTQGSPQMNMNDNEETGEEMSPRGSPDSVDSNAPTSSLSDVIKREPGIDHIVPEDCTMSNGSGVNGMTSPVNLCVSRRNIKPESPLVRLLANGPPPPPPPSVPSPASIMEDMPVSHSGDYAASGDTCGHCGIRFPDRTLYFLHKGCHAEGNPWKCNICGVQTNNVYDFNCHLLSSKHQ
ncbi:Zinc finger protein [Nesidiocoris tenuis]|uniref:Zinc finger protein n=1 Tax=Nesidiocoris tenuis TaxID=355587 RepID=A0ABN7BDI7_9HEMI|nr:Zinc finger protein [Nesidiocoris tenuis]